MLLRAPYYREDLGQDQPYISLMLVCPHCDFRCADCHNKHLADAPLREFSLTELSNIYQRSIVDGITIAGLECMLSGKQFLDDVIQFIKHNNITNVTIYSRFQLGYGPLQTFIESICKLECTEQVFVKTGEYIRGRPRKLNGPVELIEGQQWNVAKNLVKMLQSQL